MVKKNLSKIWFALRRQQSAGESALSADSELQQLSHAVDVLEHDCPEPPAFLADKIMNTIRKPAPRSLIRRAGEWISSAPAAVLVACCLALFIVGHNTDLATISPPPPPGTSEHGGTSPETRTIYYNDQRIVESVNGVLLYGQGSFGALLMMVGLMLCIGFACARKYRAAALCLAGAFLIFLVRSALSFFSYLSLP